MLVVPLAFRLEILQINRIFVSSSIRFCSNIGLELGQKQKRLSIRLMNIAAWILKKMGWKTISIPDAPDKSVICVAPHTSNWDFILGKLYYKSIRRQSGFLMKKDWFFFPLGTLLRRMGGVAIDRSRKIDTVEQIVSEFARRKRFSIAITPEGTRKARNRWKTGFYRISVGAGVPIQLAKIDYKRKVIGVFELFYPTSNIEQDLRYIQSKYHAHEAKYPHLYANPL